MRLLFVSPAQCENPRGGRAMLARLHRDALASLLEGRFAAHQLNDAPASLARRIGGYLDGATPAGIDATIEAVDAIAADTVWLDGSNLGRIAQTITRVRPSIRIITFFHNVEARFFWGAIRARPGPKAAAVLAANYIAERLAVRQSDTLICLSDRDSKGLRRLYGRGADAVAPMVLADVDTSVTKATASNPAQRYLLFVGGGFYANVAGIRWFVREVARRIDMDVSVVGHGMEAIRAELEMEPRVRVVGGVDDLAPWYRDAAAVIAPIFDGSGMKTKVAEALMFGKHVIGTPEAFSGYADDVINANWCCTDSDGFVRAISELIERPLLACDSAMRSLYDRDHSPAAARAGLARILNLDTMSGE